MNYELLTGDNRETLKTIPDNSIDAIVTDPPYGIDFLGKAWDANTGALETYQQCLRVLKPGGHILAFSAPRTYHHLAITLEQAGFEIRDQIMWIYSSGFPKSQDVGRSIERSINKAAGKPNKVIKQLDMSIDSNKTMGFSAAGKSGQLDAGMSGEIIEVTHPEAKAWEGWGTQLKPAHEPICLARKPMKLSTAKNCQQWGVGALNIDAARVGDRFPSNVLGEIADYQKYFYCPKVSRRERHVGFDTAKVPQIGSTHPDDVKKHPLWDPSIGGDAARLKQKIIDAGEYKGNNHPTVKPIELMKYLIRLITPPGGTVLDPFNGSGSTGCAAVELGHPYIGCELDQRYVEITQRRIEAWHKQVNPTTFGTLFTTE